MFLNNTAALESKVFMLLQLNIQQTYDGNTNPTVAYEGCEWMHFETEVFGLDQIVGVFIEQNKPKIKIKISSSTEDKSILIVSKVSCLRLQ